MERENYSWDLSLPSSQNGFDICSNRKIWDYILRCPYKGLFSSKQHRSTPRNNSLHPGYLTSLITRTNHNTIQTIGIYVRVFRTADHAGQIFIPHRYAVPARSMTKNSEIMLRPTFFNKILFKMFQFL